MIPLGYRAADTLRCPRHGSHPAEQFPSATAVSEAQLLAWLTGSRRWFVQWDQVTGERQERQASTPLDPDRARRLAALVWHRYCAAPAPSTATLGAQFGYSKHQAARALLEGLVHLRNAFCRLPERLPVEIPPGTQLAVALYGCEPPGRARAQADEAGLTA